MAPRRSPNSIVSIGRTGRVLDVWKVSPVPDWPPPASVIARTAYRINVYVLTSTEHAARNLAAEFAAALQPRRPPPQEGAQGGGRDAALITLTHRDGSTTIATVSDFEHHQPDDTVPYFVEGTRNPTQGEGD